MKATAGAASTEDRDRDPGRASRDAWLLVYDGDAPGHEGHGEALCTLGNGYFATRGAAPESTDDGTHYPGTYLAGVYNRLTSDVAGRSVEDEHLVNVTNWLPLDLRVGDGAWWSAGGLRALEERRELDLRHGVLTRRLRLTDEAGRVVAVVQRRLVSMARPHVAAMETTLVTEGWSGAVEVRSGVDGGIVNNNVAEFAALAHRHLAPVAVEETGPETVLVETETSQSRIRIAVAARTTVDGRDSVSRRLVIGAASAAHILSLHLHDGEALVVDKVATYATSRDHATASARLAALAELDRIGTLSTLLAAHEQAWRHLWDRFAVDIDIVDGTDDFTGLELNLQIFHLLQTLSTHTAELDAGVPARGLHGEGYRGHVFWDELFVFPLLSLRAPGLCRALLAYRWRRLDTARDAARRAGLAGALFPWQSGSDGREETPVQLFNARSGRWMPDNSHLQRHVSLAVAYNVWHYYQVSADVEFLADQGGELIVEVARLFASLATYDPATDRYQVTGVMGPDEYHDAYPGAARPGLANNAYTNVLAAWVLCRALETVRVLDEHHCGPLWQRLGLEATELDLWDRLSRRLRVPFHADGVISQFDGYDALAELDWDHYRATYPNIGRLDLILDAEGDSPNRYKLSKQADVLMLFYLFPPDELEGLFERLGYPLAADTPARTIEYYLARTAHGSTLSRVVHASVLARDDRARSWSIFSEAMRADLDDTQGGTTREGIHLGAMAGTVDLVLRGYAGVAVHDDVLWFDPLLPDGVGRIGFDLFYRGQRLRVDLTRADLRLFLHPCAAGPIEVDVKGDRRTLAAGDVWNVPFLPGAGA
ncbi:MAG: family 65 glycosyl hydrolase [Actinomycetota bacterium]|nr:family 65 glycosyl hydrolase [Actinomycetota bacterium]